MGAVSAGISAASGIVGLIQSRANADAIQAQADFQANQEEANSRFLLLQRDDVLAQADDDVVQRQQQVKRMLGEQKVSLAGQGIEIDQDLSAVLEKSERDIGIEDVHAIKNNAWRESFGLERKASDLKFQAQSTRISGQSRAAKTISEGALGAVSSFASASRSFAQAADRKHQNRNRKL